TPLLLFLTVRPKRSPRAARRPGLSSPSPHLRSREARRHAPLPFLRSNSWFAFHVRDAARARRRPESPKLSRTTNGSPRPLTRALGFVTWLPPTRSGVQPERHLFRGNKSRAGLLEFAFGADRLPHRERP